MYKLKAFFTSLLLFVMLTFSLASCDLWGGNGSEPLLIDEEIPVVIADAAIVAEGNLVPKDHTFPYFTASGKVAEILVEQGDQVQKGAVLARLGDGEAYDAAITLAKLELETAQQLLDDLSESADLAASMARLGLVDANEALVLAEERWDEFDDDDIQDELDDAEVDVVEAKDDWETAKDEYEEYKDLDKDNPTRERYETEKDDAEKEYEQAVRERDLLKIEREREKALLAQAVSRQADAQIIQDSLKNGPDPDDIRLAEARLANAEAQLASAQAALDNLDLIAPFSGTVVELNISLNEQVTAGQQVVLLADFSDWYIETKDLNELEVVHVSLGQQVTIVPDSLPEVEITGFVESISDNYIVRLGDITYTARIFLDEIDPRLRWGMTVAVTFEE